MVGRREDGSNVGGDLVVRSRAKSAALLAMATVVAAACSSVPREWTGADYVRLAMGLLWQHSPVDEEACDAAIHRAFEATKDAVVPRDTYQAIGEALRSIDNHSHLLTPEALEVLEGLHPSMGVGLELTADDLFVMRVLPGSPADRAGVAVGDLVVAASGGLVGGADSRVVGPVHSSANSSDGGPKGAPEPAAPIEILLGDDSGVGQRIVQLEVAAVNATLLPTGRMLAQRIAYLELPACFGAEAYRNYAERAHRLMQELEQGGAVAWVVDLRRNGGGHPWPILASIAPLVGEGLLGIAATTSGRIDWIYRDGTMYEGASVRVVIDSPFEPKQVLPVAVLIGPETISAGEAACIATFGLAHTRRFGMPTKGLSTSTITLRLPDDAQLVAMNGWMCDRDQRVYGGALEPDEMVLPVWSAFGRENDPTIRAAVAWIARRGDPSR
jgi:C-terminal processing protease CtpA/Prc